MAIDPSDTPALLREAEIALHKLRTGTAVVEVDCGDYRTKFAQANLENLMAYVAELRQRLAGNPQRGSIGIVF